MTSRNKLKDILAAIVLNPVFASETPNEQIYLDFRAFLVDHPAHVILCLCWPSAELFGVAGL